jgi:hypothetical protein
VRIVDLSGAGIFAVTACRTLVIDKGRIAGDFDRPAAVLLFGAGDAGAGEDPDPGVALETACIDLHATRRRTHLGEVVVEA